MPSHRFLCLPFHNFPNFFLSFLQKFSAGNIRKEKSTIFSYFISVVFNSRLFTWKLLHFWTVIFLSIPKPKFFQSSLLRSLLGPDSVRRNGSSEWASLCMGERKLESSEYNRIKTNVIAKRGENWQWTKTLETILFSKIYAYDLKIIYCNELSEIIAPIFQCSY